MPGVQGITPWGAAADAGQTLLGIGQMIFSGKRKAERNLENYANSYQPNASILDYYNKALAKYNPNAYNSQAYQNRVNMNERNLATGINASTDRRGGLGTLSGLVQGTNDANANAASQAEMEQSRNLSQLGSATQMKAAEEAKKYDMKYNLLAMKAAAANQTKAAGIKNTFGGLQSMGQLATANAMYGN